MSLEYLWRDIITSSTWDETMSLRQTLTAIRHAGKKRGRRTKINQESVSVRLENKIVRFDIPVPMSEEFIHANLGPTCAQNLVSSTNKSH